MRRPVLSLRINRRGTAKPHPSGAESPAASHSLRVIRGASRAINGTFLAPRKSRCLTVAAPLPVQPLPRGRATSRGSESVAQPDLKVHPGNQYRFHPPILDRECHCDGKTVLPQANADRAARGGFLAA